MASVVADRATFTGGCGPNRGVDREGVADAVRRGAARLATAGVDNPRLEARLLLGHAAGLTLADLLREPRARVPTAGYDDLLRRRSCNEPMAYILGHREFWSLDFLVSPATLIPRPDTETVVEAALAASPHPARILDLGTGTGCLLLSVLHERPDAFGVGIDITPDATSLAASNARRLGLADRAAFLCADWAAALDARFNLVLSNPPYVDSSALGGLMPEVAGWEPRRALDGGGDGMDAYRRILQALPGLLDMGGVAVLELGVGQSDAVAAAAKGYGFSATLRSDLAGIPRAILLRGPAS